MNIKFDHIRYLLQFCCLLVIINSVYFIVKQRQWSPIDEYAHMDYIIKLSKGQIPKISDPLSDEIILDIQQHPTRSVAKKNQTRNELGLANYSYQAKHPPLYYAALVIPNQLMTYCDVPIYHRLRIIRFISYAFYVLGILLLVPAYKELKKIYSNIPAYFPWLVILFSLLIFPHERYGLGNNALSPMMIHASLYFLIRYIISKRLRDLCMVILFTSLSV